MKKLICLLLALLILISLVACGGDTPDTDEDPKQTVGDEKPDKNTEPSNDETQQTDPTETEPTDISLRIYGEIYVSYPSDWTVKKDAPSVFFVQNSDCLVNLLCRRASSFDGELEDIVAFMSQTFADDSSKYCSGSIYGSEIETTSMERSTVAGYDCVKFEGTIKNGDWDCHVYGYGLIVEDRVMMITGLVSAKAQDAGMIAEIDALTDSIAASIKVKN